MQQLDLIASRPQYLAHLGPVWEALPEELRGSGSAGAVLVSSAQDLAAASRARYRRIAYLEHGIGQSYGGHAGYPGGAGRGPVGLFLSPNEHAAQADRSRYPAARVEVVGDPAVEHLQARQPGPQAIAVSFHWECTIAPQTRSALRHYRAALEPLAQAYPLIGHGHPRAHRDLERLWRGLHVEWVPGWGEVCRRADLYVCDNSSTLFEFAATGRPVVVLNAPWYPREEELGLRFWHDAGVGVQVDEPGQLLEAVGLALSDPPAVRSAREAALRCVYPRRSGVAQAAAEVLAEWLNES